jgi:putative transposase
MAEKVLTAVVRGSIQRYGQSPSIGRARKAFTFSSISAQSRDIPDIKLVISDAHEVKTAIVKVLNGMAALPRPLHAQCPGVRRPQADVSPRPSSRPCRRKMMPKLPRPVAQCRRSAATQTARSSRAFSTRAEADVLAYMTFPANHSTKLHSTNPLERLTPLDLAVEVVGILPKEDAIIRLVGAILLEQRTNGPSSAPVT